MRLLSFIFFIAVLFYGCSTEGKSPPTNELQKQAETFCDTAVCYPVPHDSLWNCLDTLFQSLAKKQNFSGNVLIARKGKVIYTGSFGWADAKNKIPLCDSSLFQLASISKSFTAVATLILFDKGLIKLDDNFQKYFPDFPYNDITIERLLCHRTGLPNYLYFLPNMQKGDTSLVSYKNVLDFMIQMKPEAYSKPNKRLQYCNTNYVLLANLIEKVSGISYQQFIRENIFKPLGMKKACFLSDSASQNRSLRTSGHTFNLKQIGFDRYDGVYGDKGIYCTTTDLFLFMEALFQNKILSPATLNLAIAPHNKEKISSNYGYGFRMRNFNEGNPNKIVFHNGWWHGYRTAMQRRLNDETNIVILGNSLNKTAYQTWKIFSVLGAGNDTAGVHEENMNEE